MIWEKRREWKKKRFGIDCADLIDSGGSDDDGDGDGDQAIINLARCN